MTILIPVIMSGGAGTRLWPVSREGRPKPFMKLADGETLIEKTYKRAAKLPGVLELNGKAKLLTVTSRDYYFMSRDELHKANATGSFLLEPCGRNTAPAIAMAAHWMQSKFGSDALMLVLSADHLIHDEVAFADAVNKAVSLASGNDDFLVTFGIVPSAPETGFGYIKAGDGIPGGYQVEAFVEKPDLETARKYVESGNFYWNSGMFCFSANQFLKQLSMHAPDVAEACEKCWIVMQEKPDRRDMMEIPEHLFQQVPDISIDYAVMERSNRVVVVPSDIGWNDIGSWNAIRDLVNPDSQGNRAYGDAIFVNSRNTFVQAEEDRLVAAVGIENLMIIDTPDAVLVTHSDCSQNVKQVVSMLKKSDHNAFKLHKTVYRPWGTYTVLDQGIGYKMKRIEIKPGASISLQLHHHRSECWIVVRGEAMVLNDNEMLLVKQNESVHIQAGHKHCLENRTENELIIIEVQSGAYLGEDDIVRFADSYGRT